MSRMAEQFEQEQEDLSGYDLEECSWYEHNRVLLRGIEEQGKVIKAERSEIRKMIDGFFADQNKFGSLK